MIAASWRNREGRQAWDEQVVSSWEKNKRAKRELQRRLTPIWIKQPISGGALLRHAILMEVPLVERQVARWLRGLYYDRFNKPLDESVIIKVEKLLPPEISLQPLIDIMLNGGKKPIWVMVEPNIFYYFYATAQEDKRVGFAVFVFFNTEVYLAHSDVAPLKT